MGSRRLGVGEPRCQPRGGEDADRLPDDQPGDDADRDPIAEGLTQTAEPADRDARGEEREHRNGQPCGQGADGVLQALGHPRRPMTDLAAALAEAGDYHLV